jgi:hypothetical protein
MILSGIELRPRRELILRCFYSHTYAYKDTVYFDSMQLTIYCYKPIKTYENL